MSEKDNEWQWECWRLKQRMERDLYGDDSYLFAGDKKGEK